MSFFLTSGRALTSGDLGRVGDQSRDLVTSKAFLCVAFLTSYRAVLRQSLMLLYAHALLEFVTKKYHKRERTTSTANIKVKSSLLAYNILLLAAVTPRACAD